MKETKIAKEKIKRWIEKKRKDDYWTRDDEHGHLEQGKEICLNELEEFIKHKKSEGCGKFLRMSFDCGDVLDNKLLLCPKCSGTKKGCFLGGYTQDKPFKKGAEE